MNCGDWRGYAAGCRCVACRSAMAAYKAAHRAQPSGTVDAAPVLAHLTTLHSSGLGTRQIGKLAGVSARHVCRLVAGAVTRLRPDTAARLLAVRPILAHGAIVPGTRTHRF